MIRLAEISITFFDYYAENILFVQKIELNRTVVLENFKLLKMGKDFANAMIKYEDALLNDGTFYSFDKKQSACCRNKIKATQLLK